MKDPKLSYEQHYEKLLATNNDLERIALAEFVNFTAELILKYESEIMEHFTRRKISNE